MAKALRGRGAARLVSPGSRLLFLRPPGWGLTRLVKELKILLQGGEEAQTFFSDETWVKTFRPNLLAQMSPRLPSIVLDFSSAGNCTTLVQEQLSDAANEHGASVGHIDMTDIEAEEACAEVARAIANTSNRPVAVLINRYDGAAFKNDGVAERIVQKVCGMHADQDCVSMVVVTGTLRRPGLLNAEGRLQLRDLTLDLEHNNTVGRVLQQRGSDGVSHGASIQRSSGRQFVWDDGAEAAVEVATQDAKDENKATADHLHMEGHWMGGFDETGHREMMLPESSTSSDSNADAMIRALLREFGPPSVQQVRGILQSMTFHHNLNRFTAATACAENVDDNDWGALLLMSGILTQEERSIVLHEFHTKAYLRLGLPGLAEHTALFHGLLHQAIPSAPWAAGKTLGQELEDGNTGARKSTEAANALWNASMDFAQSEEASSLSADDIFAMCALGHPSFAVSPRANGDTITMDSRSMFDAREAVSGDYREEASDFSYRLQCKQTLVHVTDAGFSFIA